MTWPVEYTNPQDERDELRLENHRLRELVQAADLVHIRLRDGLRQAADALEGIAITTTQHADYHDDPEWKLAAELRKLLGGAQ